MKKFIVDIIPLGHEAFVLLVPSAVGRKYPTASITTKGTHLIVTILFAHSWTEDAQTFFDNLQISGLSKSWTKYIEPASHAQPYVKSNELPEDSK